MDSDRNGARSRRAGFDPFGVPERIASASPEPQAPGKHRRWHRWLSDHAGLTNLGVNLTRILPGAHAPRHHRHSGRDEFIYVLSGEVVLKTDAGEEILRAGMCAGFPAGERDGYWFQNRSVGDALLLVVGDRPLGHDAGDPLLDGRLGPERRHRFAATDDGTPA